jgi:molybdopterin synthase sulfur carrier subunit
MSPPGGRKANAARVSSEAMAIVKIPPVLRAHAGGASEIETEAGTVGEALRRLADAHPDTREQLFTADGELNRYVNVYRNDEDVRVLDGLETAVAAGDTVVILPAMAGGQPRSAHA